MLRILRTFLFWTLILCACSPNGLPAGGAPPTATVPGPTIPPITTIESPTPVSTVQSLPPTKLIATLSTPHIDQPPDWAPTVPPSNPQDCGYQWAQQDLPELSTSFQQSVQSLQLEAQARAFAFGENCVHTDGTATFLPMETDFHVTLQVTDLTDSSTLGGWIVNVMQIIQNISPDQIVGPQPGRVTVFFEQGTQQSGLAFYINRYRALPSDLSNVEIYQALQAP